ncbi:hypothetical protein EW026_g207 [Hermanssonia centrifuga]|uniref:ATP-dependent DNA ligase family profile domain-containing protein n=1 Tax=Hermanssonia centrifuga TaxID=98765 RepID=A0A4S4KWA5_9APHY|nr:hypothetical protein EW026_g207 [Hermanssonia centrifuga]
MSSSIDSEHMLRRVFAAAIADHQEGVVLKANESTYNAKNLPWIKLKKDYIPGYGDAIDLVLLGASWEKDRARELRVAPTAYTTFYIGALANAEVLKTMPSVKPHFEIIFTVSYGLPRERLEELNFRIKSSDPVECLPHSRQPPTTPYSYNICHGLPLPTVMMSNPICVELYGAGFTKPPRSRYYELRFPRILKVFRPDERPWNDASTLQDLQQTAYEVVGRDRSGKAEDDWCTELWGKTASPGIKSASKRKAREEEWIEKLEDADGKPKMKAQKLDFVAAFLYPASAIACPFLFSQTSRQGYSMAQVTINAYQKTYIRGNTKEDCRTAFV